LKQAFYIVVFCVAFSFACQELPELLTLRDDCSNDAVSFVRLLSAVRPAASRPTPQGIESIRPKSPLVGGLPNSPLHPATERLARAGQELLHLLSTQRK
jgi:hypothetical protein